MRIKLTTIALDHDGRRFEEGAIVTGIDYPDDTPFGEDEIPLALAKARVDAGSAQLVVYVDQDLTPEFVQALADYVASLNANVGAMVVVLDLAERGSDEEVRAFVKASRDHFDAYFRDYGERVHEIERRARGFAPFTPEFAFRDQAVEGSKASTADDAAAFSTGDVAGAARVTAAPELSGGQASIEGGDADDTVLAGDGDDTLVGGNGNDAPPANDAPVLIEVVSAAAVEATVAEAAAPILTETHTPRSEGDGTVQAAEASAAVAQAEPVATPKPAKKSPSPKKSGA